MPSCVRRKRCRWLLQRPEKIESHAYYTERMHPVPFFLSPQNSMAAIYRDINFELLCACWIDARQKMRLGVSDQSRSVSIFPAIDVAGWNPEVRRFHQWMPTSGNDRPKSLINIIWRIFYDMAISEESCKVWMSLIMWRQKTAPNARIHRSRCL